jgi:hypothetical protein
MRYCDKPTAEACWRVLSSRIFRRGPDVRNDVDTMERDSGSISTFLLRDSPTLMTTVDMHAPSEVPNHY